MLFGAFPIVFQETRGWSPGVGGLAFLGVLVGFMIALLYIIFYENPRYARKLQQEKGWLPPEQRLPPAIIGGVLLPIASSAYHGQGLADTRDCSPLRGPPRRPDCPGSPRSSALRRLAAAWCWCFSAALII